MDNFQIETAQNINIVQHVAGLGERILAYLIDGLIMFTYILAVSFVFYNLNVDSGQELVISLTIVLPIFLYHLLWEMLWNGRSPGKAALGLRVVKLDGTRPTFSNYFLRWLLRIVDITISSGSLAIVSILLNGKGQRIGDIAATTTVITERPPLDISQIVLTEIPVDYVPKYPQVTVFSDGEMQTIKNIFVQARTNGNHNVILKLADRVAKVMEIQFEETPMVFLDRIVKDYNYYTQNL